MPLTADNLSIWDISFRWAGYDPDHLWLRFPLTVKDNFRLLMNAILHGEIMCESLTIAKLPEESKADPRFYIRTYIDEVYDCIHGVRYNRKLLKWAGLDRMELHEWCERRGIPLPEFWFPSGWKLEFEMPEFGTSAMWAVHVEPETEGDFSIRYDRPLFGNNEESYQHLEANAISKDCSTSTHNSVNSPEKEKTLRDCQRIKLACLQIASVIWKNDPNRTIASVVQDELIQKYGGANFYQEETVREWVKEIASPEVKSRRGRPRKNMNKDD